MPASIGIDDGSHEDDPGLVTSPAPDTAAAADAVDRAYRAIYEAFHRGDGVRRGLSGAGRATLAYLAVSGPITVGEAAEHLDRSQSTTSEILARLERHGLIERRRDERDARRALVWLTDEGVAVLREDRSVLSLPMLAEALAGLRRDEREAVVAALERLASAAPRIPRPSPEGELR